MQAFFNFMASVVQNPITLWSSIVIVVFFLYEYVRHLSRGIEKTRKTFDQATKLITEKLPSEKDDAAPAFLPIDGVELFPESKSLSKRWDQFQDAWIKSVHEGESKLGSIDIDRHFPMEEVLGGNAFLRKIESIPGRLLSLGILGTFIGLAFGLSNLPDAGNSPEMAGAAVKMISGLSTAFITSILGIICSLLFLIAEKRYLGEASKSVLTFRQSARSIYPILDPEVALANISKSTADQADSLRTLENDLAATLSESFGGAIQEHLAPLIQEIHNTVIKATDSTADVQVEGIKKIIDGFMTGMNEQLGSNFQQLGSSIEQASTNLGDLTAQLESAATSQAAIMERTSQTAEVLERQLPALLSFGEKLDNSATKFNTIIENIAGLEKALSSGTEQLVEAQKASESRFAGLLEHIDKSAKLVNDTATMQQESQVRMENTYKEALDSFESGISEGILQSLTSFDSVLGEVLERFSGTLADIREQYEHLSNHSNALQESLKITSTQLAENIVKAGETSTQAHVQIKELSESYLKTINHGLSTSNDTIKQLETAALNISQNVSQLQDGIVRIATKVEEMDTTDHKNAGRGIRGIFGGGR